MLSDEERIEFEVAIKEAGLFGAKGRTMHGMYELFTVPAHRQFPVDVQVWLVAHGFARREDPVNGPYWSRPAMPEEKRAAAWRAAQPVGDSRGV